MRLRLPVARTIAMLGVVSLLTDVAGEMVQPLLPLYLIAIGAGGIAVGAVEGAAEAAVSLVKVGAGRIADRAPRRKPLVLAGYGIAGFAKPALALAMGWPAVLALRSLDRVGKGIRGAPRDAMIADAAADGRRGLAFGFHRALDTLGAVIGPVVALLLLAVLGQGADAMRTVFLLTAIPMGAALLVLLVGVREPAVHRRSEAPRGKLSRDAKVYLATSALFSLANLSYAFFLLRSQTLGASVEMAVGLYILFNVVYAFASTPIGKLSDRHSRPRMLAATFLLLAVVCAGFAMAPLLLWTVPLFVLYGVFMASIETLSRAYAVDVAPANAHATMLGYYHAVTGLVALPAGLLAGLLWDQVSPQAPFLLAAFLALGSAALMAWKGSPRPPQMAATNGESERGAEAPGS